MQVRYLTPGLMLIMSSMTILADETQHALPSIEMLEFLGQWETASGEWIDPASLEDISLGEQEQKKDKQND